MWKQNAFVTFRTLHYSDAKSDYGNGGRQRRFVSRNEENNKQGCSNLQNMHRLYEVSLDHEPPENTPPNISCLKLRKVSDSSAHARLTSRRDSHCVLKLQLKQAKLLLSAKLDSSGQTGKQTHADKGSANHKVYYTLLYIRTSSKYW